MVTFTDKGAEKVREFLAAQSADVALAGLRVGVRGGGCSGFQYQLAFDEQRENDAVFESHGLKLLVDRPSLPVRAAARRSTTRRASRAPASRSTTPTSSPPAAAAPRSGWPRRSRSQPFEALFWDYLDRDEVNHLDKDYLVRHNCRVARGSSAPVNPFRFGALALDEAFTDREDELRELVGDVRNGQDVVLFAPRRYGKSSLIWRVAQQLVGDGVLVAQVDLMRTPTKEKLAEKLAQTIYEEIASPLFRARERLRMFAGLRIAPTATIDPEDGSLSFSFDARAAREDLDATLEGLLALPGRLAADRDRRVALDIGRVPGGRRDRQRAAEADALGFPGAAGGCAHLARQRAPYDRARSSTTSTSPSGAAQSSVSWADSPRALRRLRPRALRADGQDDRRRDLRGGAGSHRWPSLRDAGAALLPVEQTPLGKVAGQERLGRALSCDAAFRATTHFSLLWSRARQGSVACCRRLWSSPGGRSAATTRARHRAGVGGKRADGARRAGGQPSWSSASRAGSTASAEPILAVCGSSRQRRADLHRCYGSLSSERHR